MRILMVNWAPIRDGAAFGGGANGYCRDLALALRERGHQLASLTSGLTYVPGNDGKPGPCEIRRRDDFRGIQAYEMINSPVLAWSMHQFRHPKPEISSPVLEQEVLRFFRLWKPDIVHFHNIEGLSAACPALARAGAEDWRGARVVYSLHNYHTICPQVFLMHAGREACHDFRGGHRCATCYDAPHTHIVLADRLRDYARAAGRDDVLARNRPEGLVSRLARKEPPPIPPPAAPVRGEGDVAERAETASDRATRDFRVAVVGGALDNVVRPEPARDAPLNDYGMRRLAMVQMLNGCDRVLAVSEFVRRKFEAMGVIPSVIRTLTIGSRMSDLGASRSFHYEPPRCGDAGPSRPIRLAFLGYHNFYKGLHVLCAALELLPEATRRHIDLGVHAKDVAPMVGWLRELSTTLARVVVEDGYDAEHVPMILRGVDAGVVPSVWWDNGPQTVMEFQACGVPVIGAAVGGIPDFVRHGENGLLFRGNDARALADAIEGLVREPQRLAALRAGVHAPKSMRTHAEQIERVYGE